MRQIVWKSRWIRPYESPWSIFEKFSYANVISKTAILRTFGSEGVRSIKNQIIGNCHRDLFHLGGFEINLLHSALDFDLKKPMDELFDKTYSILPNNYNWFHSNLVWCEQCIKFGFHSILHQFVLVHNCPFHLIPLSNQCPNCKGTFPYLLSDKKMTSPFTCECGYRYADLCEGWERWTQNSTEIKCRTTKKWLEIITVEEPKSRILFIPDYAVRNKNSLEVLIHAYDESFLVNGEDGGEISKSSFNLNYKNWNILNISEMQITEQSRAYNSYKVRREYKHNRHFEEMYAYLYEKSRQIFKSVDRLIEKETLKDHSSCVTRFQEVLKEESKPFPSICPHAYAYILWKQSLLGYGKFYEFRMGANKANKYLESFELVSRFFTRENNYIFDQFLDNTYNFKLQTPWELLWVLERFTATVCLSFFRAWQHIAVNGGVMSHAPSLELLEKMVYDYMPFFVIRHQIDLTDTQPVTIFEYSTKIQRWPLKENNLVCTGERRINHKVEKDHTPIAYSMRYFESNYPDNYQEEKNYINKYLIRLNAPIKYSKL